MAGNPCTVFAANLKCIIQIKHVLPCIIYVSVVFTRREDLLDGIDFVITAVGLLLLSLYKEYSRSEVYHLMKTGVKPTVGY